MYLILLGTVSTLAGSTSSGNDDGSGSNALFNSPSGVAVDPNSGNVYVSDHINNNIRKITTSEGRWFIFEIMM